MRRILVCVLLSVLLALAPLAGLCESHFTMAGFDTETAGHVWDDNLFFLRMTERTDVSFTFKQYSDAEEWTRVKQEMLKGGELPDVLFKAELTNEETQALYDAGILIDLRPYLETNAPELSALLAEHPEWVKDISMPDGAIAALPQINALTSNNNIWINQSWLKRLDLEMPETAEQLTEVLRAFRDKDPNRSGGADEIPMTFTGMWDLRFLAHAFGFVGNDFYLEVREDGLHCDIQEEGYRDFLAWLHQLWEENLLDHNGMITADSSRQITDAKATITYGVVFGPTAMNMLPASAAGDYDTLVLAHDGKKVYRSLLGDVIRGTFAVTSACKDPGTLLSWVDYLYTEEGCFLAGTGRLGDEYEVTSDGRWYWVDDIQTVQQSVLKDATISEGAAIPVYMPAEYQMNFDDESTRRTVQEVKKVKDVSVLPYPLVWLTAEERKQIGEIWPALGEYCEVGLTWFVTGEKELNDENWEAFQKGMDELQMENIISIWNRALERRQ